MDEFEDQDYAQIENYFRETMRKTFVLGLEKNVTGAPNLSIQLPTHQHLAAIMCEPTHLEKHGNVVGFLEDHVPTG